ncbi:helix-turn-helix transcriptional regulator [Rhizobium sp. BK251]|uniref:helix-turn-helix domain-containing protein n=1 Tax=Rhizobium sp. BK251 TaxID=2512125 RepID=UPI00104F4316|nr:helix-turn-helix transcriptional regulator [Rhizobium sp. BK251]TCL73630.1 helix-turn-helix protein [Rhizobium sp. BK251]
MLKTDFGAIVLAEGADDTLGGRLSAAREAAGISVEALANQLGVRQDTLLAWETDRSEPRTSRLLKLAGILGISPMWLMTGMGEGPGEISDERALEAVKIELSRLLSVYQEMGRLIEATAVQVERLDHQIRLRNLNTDVAH